tara:strand:+ start:693 stop:1568 length:876 start_codon:yes stop_codon:yes gene_type:complete
MAGPLAFLATPGGQAAAVGGLQFLQGMMQFGAKKQEHANQVAYKAAQDEYSAWNASLQAKTSNLNKKYKYFQDQVNWGQQNNYVASLRNFELSKAIAQADVVRDTRVSAGVDYVRQSDALNAANAEQAMSDAMSLFHYKTQALRMAASAMAGGTGMVDRIQNDYQMQLGNQSTIMAINKGFRDRQLSREQAGAIAGYLEKFNSQQFYQMQEYQDPLRPFAPLPTLVGAVPPSMVGGAPSATAAFLSSAIGAVGAGINTYGTLSKYTAGGGGLKINNTVVDEFSTTRTAGYA